VKERLTGAIILVALLVLLVPELLTGPSASSAAKPAEPEGAPMRSYTIDLADDARARPGTAVSEEPVEPASVEPDVEEAAASESAIPGGDAVADSSQPGRETAGAAEDTSPATGARMGSGADEAAASATRPGSGSATSSEAEQPRSAFGPGAAERQSAASASETPARQARSDSAARPAGSDAPAKPAANESAVRRAASEPPAPRAATPSKGWAVQLGVFASRENAERLAKQVKAKGYPVVVNETSGSKRLYRVRVGPAPDRAAAVQLGDKLRAAGHAGAVVAFP
jgi:cell division septation protein DedD